MSPKSLLVITIPFLLFLGSALYNSNFSSRQNIVSAAQTSPAPTAIPPSPTPTPTAIPTRAQPPEIQARAYVVYDLPHDQVIAQHNANHPFPPASTTKIMTAVIALENYQLSEIVTVPHINVQGAKIHLQTGEQITVENLLYGLLMQSGNDAALVLADHDPEGYAGFIQKMNAKAKDLGLEATNYVNPHGLHDPLHLTSATDLLNLTKYAITNPLFSQIIDTKSKTIYSVDGQINHPLTNLNQLLGTVPGVKGVKTGWTEQAGESLVTLVDRDQGTYIITLLGSEQRFEDTKTLINWAYYE